ERRAARRALYGRCVLHLLPADLSCRRAACSHRHISGAAVRRRVGVDRARRAAHAQHGDRGRAHSRRRRAEPAAKINRNCAFRPRVLPRRVFVMKTIFLATSLLAAAAAWAASAEDLPVRSTEDVEVVFKSLDRNSDRKISRSEASMKGSVAKRFDGIDSDGDGYLSKQEFAARPSSERFE